jgi:hypothetical protein
MDKSKLQLINHRYVKHPPDEKHTLRPFGPTLAKKNKCVCVCVCLSVCVVFSTKMQPVWFWSVSQFSHMLSIHPMKNTHWDQRPDREA